MAAPDFVPTDPRQRVRTYSSPPRRPGGWAADRPGDLAGGQPKGARLGSMGPDQGYAYRLVTMIEEKLHLGRMNRDDVVEGCVAVAMRRSALYGRAPVIHDLNVAFGVFGFFDANPPAELVSWREELFAEVRSDHHYVERRELVDLVPDEVLRRSPEQVLGAYETDWRQSFDLPDE